ncbi:MAG: ion transporter [Candidatus Woesearchaeota archaeon]
MPNKNKKNEDLKSRLNKIINGSNENDTKSSFWFDFSLFIIIIVSVVCVVLEGMPNLSEADIIALKMLEWAFTIIFTIEYLLRIYVANQPKKYIFSFFGIVDFISIIPTYLSLLFVGAQYFAVVRVLRLLRILRYTRVVKLSR